MKNFCTLCKEIPNIKINGLKYCNECFMKQLEIKIHKNLRKLPYKSNIMIFFSGNLASMILLHFLDRLKHKKIHSFDIFLDKNFVDKSISENIFVDKYDFLNNRMSKTLFIDYKNDIYKNEIEKVLQDRLLDDLEVLDNLSNSLINLKTDVLLINKTVEQMCSDIFLKISTGLTIDETDVNDFRIQNRLSVINMYKDIKNKEIQYAGFLLKNIFKFETKKNKKSKTQISVENFIREIDKNNSLALFNIINTVKKINKK